MSKKQATISFFELKVSDEDGVIHRAQERSWNTTLSMLTVTQQIRTIPKQNQIIDGFVHEQNNQHSLSLSIDRIMRPRERNIQSGQRQTMYPSAAAWDPAEESIIVFLPRNIFGILSTGLGAPNNLDVARWLNGYAPPKSSNDKFEWVAQAIIDPDLGRDLLNQPDIIVSRAEITVEPHSMSDEDLSILGLIRESFGGDQTGVDLTLVIQAKRGKAAARDSPGIAQKIVDAMKLGPKKARMNAKFDGHRTRTFDLLGNKLTHKIEVDAEIFNDGEVFASEATKEIREAYLEQKDILDRLVPETPE